MNTYRSCSTRFHVQRQVRFAVEADGVGELLTRYLIYDRLYARGADQMHASRCALSEKSSSIVCYESAFRPRAEYQSASRADLI